MRGRLEDEATISDFLIAFLLSARSSVAFRRIMRERVLARHKTNVVSVALNRLKKRGLLAHDHEKKWHITLQGKTWSKTKKRQSIFLSSPFSKNTPDSLIVSFDIPENNRRNRDWLRAQLRIFGYRMIQKSVWVGPGPLSKEFHEETRKRDLKEHIRTFKLSRSK